MTIRHRTDTARHSIDRNIARRTVDHTCSPRNICVRCSMMKIFQQRFKAFRLAFGRNPLPHEPVFFAENSSSPRIAGSAQIISQLTQAADAAAVPLPPLLKFLGLK